MTKRLDVPWLQGSDVAALFDALGAQNARLVGGCVRDGLLGEDVADIDLATVHPPETTIALCEHAGLKTFPTGIAHGTITVVSSGKPYEVTTLRHDVETDGRRAKVAFTDDWQADAARRDFTINALYADADGQIYDYFSGLEDLARRHVRFIGDASTRIQEDVLRILRFYRFSARFSQKLDDVGRAACRHWAGAVKSLSRERIHAEWLKLLSFADPSYGVLAMHDDAVLQTFLPEAHPERLVSLIKREALIEIAPNPIRRFAAILPPDEKTSQVVARRLKCSNDQCRALAARTGRLHGDENLKQLLYRMGSDLAVDLALLSDVSPDVLTAIHTLASAWQSPTFPLRGQDLLDQTSLRGPEIGRALHALKQQWIESGFTLTQEALLDAAKSF